MLRSAIAGFGKNSMDTGVARQLGGCQSYFHKLPGIRDAGVADPFVTRCLSESLCDICSRVFSAVFVSLLAIILECLQVLMPGRFFDPVNIAWSIAGAFFWGFCAGSLFEDFQAPLDL